MHSIALVHQFQEEGSIDVFYLDCEQVTDSGELADLGWRIKSRHCLGRMSGTWVAEGALDGQVADLSCGRASSERVEHHHLHSEAVGGLGQHSPQLSAAQTADGALVHGKWEGESW